MAYKVADLQSDVLRRIKDSSFSTELIKDFMQDIQDEALGQYHFPFMEKTLTTTLAADDLSYDYPDDLQVVFGVKLVDPDDDAVSSPIYAKSVAFDAQVQSPEDAVPGLPCIYTDFGHTLYWDRPLDKAYGLQLKYLRAPVRFTTGDVIPDIPEEYQAILIRGGLAGVEEYRGNFDIAALHRRKVEDLTHDMLSRYTLRQLTSLPKSTIAGRHRGTF